MRIIFLRLAVLTGLLALVLPGWATHFMGAEITYQHMGGSIYRIYHKTYYDCGGGATTPLPGPPPYPTVDFIPVGIGSPLPTPVGSWVLYSYAEISPTCPAIPTLCTSPGSPINGVLEAIFYADYDFFASAPGSGFRIQWSNCCRNSTITSGSNDESIYVSTSLTVGTTANSSPTFQYPPVAYINAGQPYILSQGAFDAEGDSLVYALGPCYQGFTQQATYAPGYSPTTPLGSSWNCSMNPVTGEISLLPTPVGAAVTAILGIVVNEYRNGVLIGTVNRDMQITVLPNAGGTNNTPVVSGIQNLSGGMITGANTILALPGGTVGFDLTVTDADAGQVLGFMTSPMAALYGTSITQVGSSTNPLTVHVSRVLPANQTGQFTVGLNFFDDFCPLKAFATTSYLVKIDTALLHTTAVATPTACGTNAGALDVFVLGNHPPYTFLWSTGDTTEDLSGIAPGFYSLTTTDSAGHVSQDTFLVPGGDLIVTLNDTWVNCLATGGELTASVSGAIAPYTFLWNTGQTTGTISGLAPGGYHVYVTDSTGCINEAVTVIGKPDSCDAIIGGKVFLEFNVDCTLDTFEYPVPFTYIDFTPGGGMFTDAQGNYEFRGDTGLVVIKAFPPAPMVPSPCSAGDSLIKYPVTYGYDTTGNDFPLHITSITAPPLDLCLDEWSSPGRPGFNRAVVLTATNQGWVSSTPTVTWTHDSLFQFVGAVPVPTSYDPLTHTAVWSGLPALGAFQSQYFYIQLSLDSTAALGVWFCDTAWVSGSPADTVLPNNIYIRCDTTRGSYDPNIKEVSPRGETAEGYIRSSDDILRYTIHFQNTGTDTAFYVTVRDTLDTDLDLKRFRHVSSSAPYKLLVEGDNVLIFRFDHINLPDSGTDMTGSMGFVTFTLPLKQAAQGTVIDNHAAIYFDFNAPIITNTVRNTICNQAKTDFTAVRGNDGKWQITSGLQYAEQWYWDLGPAGVSFAVTPEPFALPDSGTYTLRLIARNACSEDTTELVIHEVWTTGLDAGNLLGISVQPNPVTASARIRIADAGVRTATVTDLAGRTVQTLSLVNGEATFVRGDLPAGVYYVRASNADGQSAGVTMMVE